MKKWLFNSLLILILPGLSLLLDGCYPNNSISLAESGVTVTRYDESIDFQSLKTYYMHDEVIPMRADTSDRTPIPEEALILSLIEQNLSNYGWVRIAEGDDTLGTIYWEGALYGVLTSSNIDNRLTIGINQQYTQSPYLNLK